MKQKPHIRKIRRDAWVCATYAHGGIIHVIGIGTTPRHAYNTWESQRIARYGR